VTAGSEAGAPLGRRKLGWLVKLSKQIFTQKKRFIIYTKISLNSRRMRSLRRKKRIKNGGDTPDLYTTTRIYREGGTGGPSKKERRFTIDENIL
jgi:hypothetical protein